MGADSACPVYALTSGKMSRREICFVETRDRTEAFCHLALPFQFPLFAKGLGLVPRASSLNTVALVVITLNIVSSMDYL